MKTLASLSMLVLSLAAAGARAEALDATKPLRCAIAEAGLDRRQFCAQGESLI